MYANSNQYASIKTSVAPAHQQPGAEGGFSAIKIHIARNDLLAELSLPAEIVEPKSLLPTLSYLLIEAARDRLILRAASLNNTLQCEIGADVIEPGAVCLPARKFYEIVRQLPPEIIAISGDERSASLKSGANFSALPHRRRRQRRDHPALFRR